MAGTTSEFRLGLRAARVTLVVGVSLLCLLAAEAIARLSVDSIPQLDLDIYRKSGDGQLLLRPGITRRHSTRHWDVTVSINEQGWRDRPGLGSAGESVILGLGDSFAFGWGVELEDSMFFLLEQQLSPSEQNLTGRHRMRILKAGVPGTGPGDQLRLLQTLGPKYQPSAVVLIFFVGNDFVDVQMGGARQFQVQSGLLVRQNLSQETPNAFDALRIQAVRKSRLLQLLMGVWWQWSRVGDAGALEGTRAPRRWDDWMREFAQINLQEYPTRTAEAVKQTLDLLTEIQQACRARSAAFLLAVIPRSYQIYEDETKELKTSLGLSAADLNDDLDLDKPQRILKEWAGRSGVRVVDLLDSFREHHRTHPQQRLFYYPDAHLNRLGHRVAAETIQPALSQLIQEQMTRKGALP